MTELELSKALLEKYKLFEPIWNKRLERMTEVLEDVPKEMARVLSIYSIAALIGQVHLKIMIDEDTDNKVPMNVIAFILAHSGARKTSSIKVMEKLLKGGYDSIKQTQDQIYKMIEEQTGEKPTEISLSATVSKNAGLVWALNELQKMGIGTQNLVIDEVVNEFKKKNPQDFIDNIQLLSQMFDDGDYTPRAIKTVELRESAVKGMSTSALLIGAEYGLLEDDKVLSLFMEEYISKLSRRSLFVYPDFEEKVVHYEDWDDYERQERLKEEKEKEIRTEFYAWSKKVIEKYKLLDAKDKVLKMHPLVWKLTKAYKVYNIERAKKESKEYVQLEVRNREWKSLKIAGLMAVLNDRDEILVDDLREAITLVESMDGHLDKFITKANQTKPEKLAFVLTEIKSISYNELLKKKYVRSIKEIPELVNVANSMYTNGTIEIVGTNVVAKSFDKVTEIGISYKQVSGVKEVMEQRKCTKKEAKEFIAKMQAVEGYNYVRAKFEHFEDLLKNNCAYIPFKLKDGIKRTENIVGTSQIVILDIDNSDITDEEAHDLLMDYNHMIARGSDKNNPFKMRILLPVDVEIDLDASYYPDMYRLVGEDLGLEVDALAKNQFFFGYADREVLKNFDGEDYQISKILPKVKNISKEKTVEIYEATERQIESFRENRRKILHFAYNAEHQEEQQMFLAMQMMINKGLPEAVNKEICDEIFDEMPGKVRPGFKQNLNNQRHRKYVKKYQRDDILD